VASTITLRRKIKATISTKQITRAMQMVAASKMHRAQEAVKKSRDYSDKASEVLRNLSADTSLAEHPLLTKRSGSRVVLLLLSSDRGLCGALNAQAFRVLMDYLNEHKNETIQIVTSGRKAEEFAKRYLASVQMPNVHVGACFNGFPDKPTIDHVKPFSQLTVNPYITNQIDRLDILSSKFVSTLVQKPTLKTLLPITVPQADDAATVKATEFLFEPSKAEVINKIVPALINSQLYQIFLDQIACEHSARMVAMKNATENAAEVIDELKQKYNSARQSKITAEIAEVTAGAAALS
jgi:F-type H+-transporting ATPase subunit gamma